MGQPASWTTEVMPGAARSPVITDSGTTPVGAGTDSAGAGMVINSSRAILYASRGPNFAEAARGEAIATRDAIRSHVPR